jgi:hypothetical protein
LDEQLHKSVTAPFAKTGASASNAQFGTRSGFVSKFNSSGSNFKSQTPKDFGNF